MVRKSHLARRTSTSDSWSLIFLELRRLRRKAHRKHRRNSDMALYETDRQLESLQMDFFMKTNELVSISNGKNSRILGEITMKSRLLKRKSSKRLLSN